MGWDGAPAADDAAFGISYFQSVIGPGKRVE